MTSTFNSLPIGMPRRFEPLPIARAPKAVREYQPLEPTTIGPFGPTNKKITIMIPPFGIMDMRRGFLVFKASCTGGSTWRAFHNGIWNIFDRIEVSQAGQGTLENAQEYGREAHRQYLKRREADVDDYIGKSCFGIGTNAHRRTLATGVEYAIPLVSGFFGIDPIDVTQLGGQLQIDFWLNDAAMCMEANDQAPALAYSVSDFTFYVEKLNFASDSVESKLIKSRASWRMKSWRAYMVTPALGSTNWSIQIDHKTNSVEGFSTYMNLSADMSNPLILDRYETFIRNNVTQYQPVINGKPIPGRPIKCGTTSGQPAYVIMLANEDKWELGGSFTDPSIIDKTAFDTNKFIVNVPFTAFPGSPQLLNSFNTAEAGTTITVEFQASAAPAAAFNQYTFVYFNQILTLSGGLFKVVF